MALPDELEKLAQLHQRGALTAEEFSRAKAKLLTGIGFVGVRKQSSTMIFGLPLWAFATGPDPARGEMRGHAKGIIAIGDIATGVLALGGLARGLFALGGLALGVFSLGGMAIGLALAVGGAAIGGIALGGGAAGAVAVGGGALGHYAFGGGAGGTHVISALRCDPEAAQFFRKRFASIPLVGEFVVQPLRAATARCGEDAQGEDQSP